VYETYFDFEDGSINSADETLTGLDTYMSNTFGYPAVTNLTEWKGNSTLFGSDAIFTTGTTINAILDFDPAAPGASNAEITAVSFDWGVIEPTGGFDWILTVRDDVDGTWKQAFTINFQSAGDTGFSGLITFPDAWEVTRLRFRDSGIFKVGMDNLTIYQTFGPSPVPEPSTLLLLGSGLAGLGFFRRRRKTS